MVCIKYNLLWAFFKKPFQEGTIIVVVNNYSKKFYSKRKGFTLVEVLIVIIIIGILSGLLMLAVESGQDKARATKIVMNLKSVKTAAVFAYFKNKAWPSAGEISSLDEYLDRSLSSSGSYDISIVSSDEKDYYYVGYINDSELTDGVKAKLQVMREKTDVPLKNSDGGEYSASDNYPYMRLN